MRDEEHIQQIMSMSPDCSRQEAERLLGHLKAWLNRFLDDYLKKASDE